MHATDYASRTKPVACEHRSGNFTNISADRCVCDDCGTVLWRIRDDSLLHAVQWTTRWNNVCRLSANKRRRFALTGKM